jgi:EAL domain-containing protein (putative c-di-GMP-specific phosphodiesterase class I)/GGDEF domain-containing protein
MMKGGESQESAAMSLYKQLWLTTVCMVAITFGATFVVTSLSTKEYLEHHLFMKNVETASVIALYLDQRGEAAGLNDTQLLEHLNTGQHQLIEIRSSSGEQLAQWTDSIRQAKVPGWFRSMLNITVKPGQATMKNTGALITVESNLESAYKNLWLSTIRLAAIFLAVTAIAGLIATAILRMILRPMRAVVEQAKAISERRFVTMREPRSPELQSVARSMNNLSLRVKRMLDQESVRLERWRQEAHTDEVTGVLNRDHFIKLFESTLQADDESASGVISLIRISHLSRLNQLHGRDSIDKVLQCLGEALEILQEAYRDSIIGRLNGADFAMLSPREIDPGIVGKNLQSVLREVMITQGLEADIALPGASTNYGQGDAPGQLLANLDSALLNSEQQGESEMVVMGRNGVQMMPMRQELKRWRSMLYNAFNAKQFSLASFPVVNLDGSIIHSEAPVRLHWRNNNYTAGQFLPWINRLGLADELDRTVVELALDHIEATGQPIGINLSGAAVANPNFLPWISDRLSSRIKSSQLLWLEVTEATAYRHLINFKRLCTRCKRYGAHIGIEHMGHQLSDMGRLHDVGVDYVKVDAAFISGVNGNPANQTLLRTLCTLAHSLGITVIAEGVDAAEDWDVLDDLGFDAATGPLVTSRHSKLEDNLTLVS